MRKSNPIGTGTRNVTLNAPKEWALELGRAAFKCGLSLGEYLRRLTERGMELENPGCALRLRNIRRQYYGTALVLLLAYVCLVLSSGVKAGTARIGSFGWHGLRMNR